MSCTNNRSRQTKNDKHIQETVLYPVVNNKVNNNLNIFEIMKKPSNRLYLSSSHCQFDLFVNDVPLFRFWGRESESGMGMMTDNFLNPFILTSGEHEIKVRIYPRFGQESLEFHSHFEMEIYVVDAATHNFDEKVVLLTMSTPERIHKDGIIENPLTGLPYFEMRTTVKLQVPFELIGWRNSVDLRKENEEREIFQEVLQAYKEIYSMIKNRELDRLKTALAERENILNTAFYLSEERKAQEWQDFIDMISCEEFELAPFPQDPILHFQGHGRMVVLLNHKREDIIRLVNREDPMDQIILEFRFHRKEKGDKLTVI